MDIFIKVNITRVGKFRQFPLLSKEGDNGVRMRSSDLVGEVVFIDKAALEDAIHFQDMEFEIIDG